MAYQRYNPTKWEERIDSALRLIAPRLQLNRVLAREKEHYFRYLSAQGGISRHNSGPSSVGETMKGSREKLQVMWNAINCVDNSGLCTGLLTKFQTYVCGSLRFQARTGDRVINNEYEDYMQIKLKNIDLTGRWSFRQMCMQDIRSIMIKGDIGCNIVRDGREIYLQGIEADRIGNPYDYEISDRYIRGLMLSAEGLIEAVKVFRRDRANGVYVYDQTFPTRDAFGMPKFLFIANPITYDDYRGVSVFKTAIDNATYIDRMREYELQALMWAASQSGVFHTQSGLLPDQLPFDSGPPMDYSGNTLQTYQVRPNTVTALGVGEQVTMFQHDRPSPNVIGMFRDTIRDIAVGTGLSYEFIWDQSQLTGPAVRAVSGADARAIEMWQQLLLEQKIDPVTMLVLGNAIANGELPYHPQWRKWQWFFPPKGTIDVGRESQANIQEIAANINTGARVAAEDGQDINEIQFQRGRETEQLIQVAMVVAKNLSAMSEQPIDWREVYAMMTPAPRRGGAGGFGAAGGSGSPFGPGGGGQDGQDGSDGATSEGVDIDEKKSRFRANGHNGHRPLKITTTEEFEWYREDQARDEKGRFADEGGGAAAVKEAPVAATEVSKAAEMVKGGLEGSAARAREAPDLKPAQSPEDLDRFLADQAKHPIYQEMEGKLHKMVEESPNRDIEQWSLSKHIVNGQLTPEQEAEHQRIVNKFLNPNAAVKPGERPKMIMFVGQPGSGKTTAGGQYANEIVPESKRTLINPDDIRHELPDYEGWNAPATQAEAKLITENKLIPAAISARHNILIDQTGSNTGKMERIVNEFGKKDYDVHLVHVDAPLHESANRIWERFMKGQKANGKGRFVDPKYLTQAVDGNPKKTYEALKNNPNVKSGVSVYNGSEGKRILERWSRE